jgi:cytochrome c oxidase subunit IV
MAEHHNSPTVGIYLAVFSTLMVLTAATVWAAFQDFGAYNNVVALGIACIKAFVVIVFFMHVKYASRLVWLFVGAGFLFLLIMFAFLMADYLSRGWLGAPASYYLSIQ